MDVNCVILFLFAAVLLLGIPGFVIHNRAYGQLYRHLRERGLVDIDLSPTWTTRIGAGGCMGLIKRIKQEVGLENLRPAEMALINKASYAYNFSVPAVFLLVCVLFWIFYK